jgi:hypothetical protein
MNIKRFAPIIVGLAPAIAAAGPALLFFGGLTFIVWLLDKEKPEELPENVPASLPPLPFPPNSGRNSAQNPYIPANSAGKVTVPPPLPSFPDDSVLPEPEIPPPLPSVLPVPEYMPETPLPARKKFITREDMATIFHDGARTLTRKAAVADLKALGFGKSAAYEALAIGGRFSAWLRFASDRIISWKS